MGYSFGGDHVQSIINILHSIRFDEYGEGLPVEMAGYNRNLLMETAIDAFYNLRIKNDELRKEINALRQSTPS